MNHNKLRVYSAAFTSAAALGGLMVAGAEARSGAAPQDTEAVPANIDKLDKKLPIGVPRGVKSLKSESAISKEMGEAVRRLHRRWENGVLVLREPKMNAQVTCSRSPSAYDVENNSLQVLKGAEQK